MKNNKIITNFTGKKADAGSLLLRFSMKWHGQVMKDTLIRYKILLFFLAAIIAPSFTSLMNIIVWPVKGLVIAHPGIFNIFISLLAYQLLALIWIAVHQRVFVKQPWEKYLLSLQLTDKQKIYSDIAMLLMSDLLICIPIILAGGIEGVKSYPSFINLILIVQKLLLNISLILFIQLIWIKQRYILFLSVLLLDSVAICQSLINEPGIQSIITFGILFFTLTQFIICYKKPKKRRLQEIKTIPIHHNAEEKSYVKNMPFVRIQVKNMFMDNYAQASMSAMVILLTTVFSLFVLIYGKDSPVLLLIILAIMFINSFTVSNLFVKLYEKRNTYTYYLFSLPMTRITIFKNDLLILGPILLFSNMLILLFTIYTGLTAQLTQFSVAVLGSIIFLIISYFPQIKFKHYGQFISLILMIVFITIIYFSAGLLN